MPASALRKELLLQSCNLHTVLDMPGGTFQGAGVKDGDVLFFREGRADASASGITSSIPVAIWARPIR